jgi:hypothetical protein
MVKVLFDPNKVRERLVSGTATDEDLTWARSRRNALDHWPEELDKDQKAELEMLNKVLG